MPCNICKNPSTSLETPPRRIMAEIIADPGAIRGMRDEVPGWWDGLDESRRTFFIETLESDGPQMNRPSGRTPGGRR